MRYVTRMTFYSCPCVVIQLMWRSGAQKAGDTKSCLAIHFGGKHVFECLLVMACAESKEVKHETGLSKSLLCTYAHIYSLSHGTRAMLQVGNLQKSLQQSL